MSDPDALIVVTDVVRTFEGGRIPALRGASLTVGRGEYVAVMGPSGCGKSTLLHLIAALDRPDGGSIVVGGVDVGRSRELDDYRARTVGLIFQLHNLLPTLTASENVQIAMFGVRSSGHERQKRAEALLTLVGMADKRGMRPAQLSGGERQRVAVARALANDPPILLADEPTGSLDSDAGARVLNLIDHLRSTSGLTVVLVTHDESVASRADRIVRMLDGRVVGEDPEPASEETAQLVPASAAPI